MAVEQTINVPQLLLVLLIGGIAIRWFFFSGSTSRSTTRTSSTDRNRVREADVERIKQMFPQIATRTIMWDLQRNGGNVAATTERILSGRSLETVSRDVPGICSAGRTSADNPKPPQTFQPSLPASASSSSTSPVGGKPAAPKASQPDLITRYNLTSKLANEDAESDSQESTSTVGGKTAWSQNKNERQALLQRRREEMILAARKKMQAKVAAERGNEEAGSG
jgi:coupling of ubiquitin conjugation to ER degradation protein 1